MKKKAFPFPVSAFQFFYFHHAIIKVFIPDDISGFFFIPVLLAEFFYSHYAMRSVDFLKSYK